MGGDDALDETKVRVCNACYCCYNGLMFENCIGIVSSGACLVCEFEFCLKPGVEKKSCICCEVRKHDPCICYKVQFQECCVVGAAACPPDDEVPKMFALYGFMCSPKTGCLIPLGDAKG